MATNNSSAWQKLLGMKITAGPLIIGVSLIVGMSIAGLTISQALVGQGTPSPVATSSTSDPTFGTSSSPTPTRTPVKSSTPVGTTPPETEVIQNKKLTPRNVPVVPDEPAYVPPVDPGPSAADIALVQAQRDSLNLEILNSTARQATSQGQLDLQIYFLSVAEAYSDSVSAGIIRGKILTIQAAMANEAAYLNLLSAQLNALPAY
jgi:hypothetical protein